MSVYARVMEQDAPTPKALLEAVRYFSDPDVSQDFFVRLRWPNGVTCPTCGSDAVSYMPTYRRWVCRTKHPKRQFSAKVGTIFEDSPLPLEKWLLAVWLIANAKNGISSYEIARALSITQKSAWFMLHRIRLAMQTGTFEKMQGRVEVDETFIAGAAPLHAQAKERGAAHRLAGDPQDRRDGAPGAPRAGQDEPRPRGRGPYDAAQGAGPEVRATVEPGAEIITDSLPSYDKLADEYTHNVINHAESYVRGHVHANGMENFWSLLKRALKGTSVSVELFHLFRYLDEEVFRFNERKDPIGDGGRFVKVLRRATGRRLTYKGLTAATAGRAEAEAWAGPAQQ